MCVCMCVSVCEKQRETDLYLRRGTIDLAKEPFIKTLISHNISIIKIKQRYVHVYETEQLMLLCVVTGASDIRFTGKRKTLRWEIQSEKHLLLHSRPKDNVSPTLQSDSLVSYTKHQTLPSGKL